MAKSPSGKTKQKDEIEKIAPQDDVITPEVIDAIKTLPESGKKAVIKAISLSVTRHRSGPLPDGDDIKIYADVIPNGGDRLMKTVEAQLQHRLEIESHGVKRSFNQSSTGQWMAFVLAILFGYVAWDLAKSGKEVAASIIGGVDIIGLVTVFITSKVSSK